MNASVGLFGIIELDKDPPRFSDLFDYQIKEYLINVGGFAAIGLVIWIITVLTRSSAHARGTEGRQLISKVMWGLSAGALAAYVVGLVLTILAIINRPEVPMITDAEGNPVPMYRPPTMLEKWQDIVLAIAGALAIAAIIEPFIRDFLRLRWRRIWALAKLSFKEAIRRKVVWAFMAFFVIFLFPASWIPSKPEDELRKTINVIFYGMTPLLVLIALLLSAFSIPNDIKNQTIHTIVTKPVERFEIVLGRFFGYVALLTIAIFVFTSASLVLIMTSNIDPLAKQESMTARLPIYGDLEFKSRKGDSRKGDFKGIDVGREYSYRKYIAGGELSSHRAMWDFVDVPSSLADRPAIPCEFAFDIYRTTKGEENRGVYCSFNVITWKWDASRQQEYEAACRKAFETYPPPPTVRAPVDGDPPGVAENWKRLSEIAEQFGRFEKRNLEVYDYHIGSLMIPPGIFKNAQGRIPEGAGFATQRGPAPLQIQVKCESASQFLGVARLDLYLKEAEGSFALNFYKSAIGLWCRLCIVILLAVSCSTYLAGVISFLVAMFLFVAGHFKEFIFSLAAGTNVGGGPFEALARLVRGEVVAAQLDQTPTIQALTFLDRAFRWVLGRIMDVFPDAEQFGWSIYVKEGFSLRPDFVILHLIYLVAYLLPWLILAYYLMRSREIAA